MGGGEEQGGGELEQYRLRYVLAVLRLRICGRRTSRTTPPLALLIPRPTPRPRLREEATVLVRLRLVVVAVFIVVLHLWAVAGGSTSRCSARPAPPAPDYAPAIAATSFEQSPDALLDRRAHHACDLGQTVHKNGVKPSA